MPNPMTPKRPVTMRDVAKAAGVSRMTVSRALKKDSPVSKETRDLILKTVKDMNYVPDLVAGSLTTKKSGFVAALLPSLNNLHFAQTVQALTDAIEPAGLQILLGHTDYSAEREEELVELMLRRRPEAIVLSYDGHTDRTVELLRDVSIPVVEIWETPRSPLGYTVGFSNRQAAAQMTEALIAQGYRNITFVGEADDDWTRGSERRKGFSDAMTNAGFAGDRVVQFGNPPLSIENGALAAEQALREYPESDCLFCVSDSAAFGVQSHLLMQGHSVPGDIAVVGFGNFEVSRFASPSISTVVVDPFRIGRETGQLITKLLSDSESDAPQNTHVAVELEFRESSK